MREETRRLGIFEISHDYIDNRQDVARMILRDCIVVRAESRFDMSAIEYMAIHPAFAETPLGSVVPRYKATITSDAEGNVVDVSWWRV